MNSVIFMLIFFSAHLAGANTDEIDEAAVMFATVATVFVRVANVKGANILHFGSKGIAIIIVLRMCKKIGIEWNRSHHWILAVTFFVVSVIEIECATRVFDARIKVSLLRDVFFLLIQLQKSFEHQLSPFCKISQK